MEWDFKEAAACWPSSTVWLLETLWAAAGGRAMEASVFRVKVVLKGEALESW